MDNKGAKELSGPVKKFYKGEPLALGITQILIGVLGILLGVVLNVAYYNSYYHFIYVIVMTPYWTGVLFIISGSLSVAAARNPKPSLVKGMLGMNVVSAVAASIGIVILCISLGSRQWRVRYMCTGYYSRQETDIDPLCHENVVIPYNIMFGMMAILLLFAILEFGISISNAAFGCKTLCRDTYTETVVVVYQSAPPDSDAYLPVVHQEVPPDNLPAASKDAKNL